MSQVILYVASSLDGYIARPDGSVDWLDEIPDPGKDDTEDYGYGDFYAGVDVVLMGRITYEQVLSFDVDYPYAGKEGYVFSRTRAGERDEHVKFENGEDIAGFVENLKRTNEGNLWLVGGGQLVREFLNLDLVDRIELFILPVILGQGLPLFPPSTPQRNLSLVGAHSYANGMAQLTYSRTSSQ